MQYRCQSVRRGGTRHTERHYGRRRPGYARGLVSAAVSPGADKNGEKGLENGVWTVLVIRPSKGVGPLADSALCVPPRFGTVGDWAGQVYGCAIQCMQSTGRESAKPTGPRVFTSDGSGLGAAVRRSSQNPNRTSASGRGSLCAACLYPWQLWSRFPRSAAALLSGIYVPVAGRPHLEPHA